MYSQIALTRSKKGLVEIKEGLQRNLDYAEALFKEQNEIIRIIYPAIVVIQLISNIYMARKTL